LFCFIRPFFPGVAFCHSRQSKKLPRPRAGDISVLTNLGNNTVIHDLVTSTSQNGLFPPLHKKNNAQPAPDSQPARPSFWRAWAKSAMCNKTSGCPAFSFRPGERWVESSRCPPCCPATDELTRNIEVYLRLPLGNTRQLALAHTFSCSATCQEACQEACQEKLLGKRSHVELSKSLHVIWSSKYFKRKLDTLLEVLWF